MVLLPLNVRADDPPLVKMTEPDKSTPLPEVEVHLSERLPLVPEPVPPTDDIMPAPVDVPPEPQPVNPAAIATVPTPDRIALRIGFPS